MKITLLGPAFPYRGGLAAFNERLARQLATECKNVDIRTFSLQYPGILFPGKTQYSDTTAPEGIRIVREINSISPFNWLRKGLKLKKEKPDILLLRFWLPFLAPCFGVIARIVRSNHYTLVISIFDNVVPHEKRPFDRILTRFFVRSIDGAIVLSDVVFRDLEMIRKDIPICLTPHPMFDNYGKKMERIDALSALKLDPGNLYILFFGFIRRYKGLDLLIEAFADNRLRNMNIKLIVAGEFYESEAPYRELINKYSLQKDIILYSNYIKDDEVSLFFSGADLVVQPYRSATQSGVTQIAYHFDKPMLVTNVGGLREIVCDGKCGYVVEPSPEKVATAIVDYFENNRSTAFSAAVKGEKGKYSWDKMTDSITEVFYKCLLKQLVTAL